MDHAHVIKHNIIEQYVKLILPLETMDDFEDHLLGCSTCQEELITLTKIVKLLHLARKQKTTEKKIPCTLDQRIIQLIADRALGDQYLPNPHLETLRLYRDRAAESKVEVQLHSPSADLRIQCKTGEISVQFKGIISGLQADQEVRLKLFNNSQSAFNQDQSLLDQPLSTCTDKTTNGLVFELTLTTNLTAGCYYYTFEIDHMAVPLCVGRFFVIMPGLEKNT